VLPARVRPAATAGLLHPRHSTGTRRAVRRPGRSTERHQRPSGSPTRIVNELTAQRG
jgi:hypothetical protein